MKLIKDSSLIAIADEVRRIFRLSELLSIDEILFWLRQIEVTSKVFAFTKVKMFDVNSGAVGVNPVVAKASAVSNVSMFEIETYSGKYEPYKPKETVTTEVKFIEEILTNAVGINPEVRKGYANSEIELFEIQTSA